MKLLFILIGDRDVLNPKINFIFIYNSNPPALRFSPGHTEK